MRPDLASLQKFLFTLRPQLSNGTSRFQTLLLQHKASPGRLASGSSPTALTSSLIACTGTRMPGEASRS